MRLTGVTAPSILWPTRKAGDDTGGIGSGTPLVIQSSYDPEVEFMELAVTVGSTRDWLVHRPDVNGRYGGLQGAGGLDAVVNDGTSVATGIVSDIYGHTEATITGSALTWNSVRSAGLDMDSNHAEQPTANLQKRLS
jgi:hypothetical protein